MIETPLSNDSQSNSRPIPAARWSDGANGRDRRKDQRARLQNVSKTGGDSRGLQGTPGEGLGNKLRGGSSPILGSRSPSPVRKCVGTGSTPAASAISKFSKNGPDDASPDLSGSQVGATSLNRGSTQAASSRRRSVR